MNPIPKWASDASVGGRLSNRVALATWQTPIYSNLATLHKIYYRAFKYLKAVWAATAPSPTAVTTWRREVVLTSPAANIPGIDVLSSESVSI